MDTDASSTLYLAQDDRRASVSNDALSIAHGPENISCLRRFAVGLIQSKPGRKVAETLRLLNRNIRLVFDWLLMTENFRRTSPRVARSRAGLTLRTDEKATSEQTRSAAA